MARILLIDDNEEFLRMAAEYLRRAGHDVKTAENGKAAMRLLSVELPFDLIATDLIMPEKEGIELIIEVRRANPRQKVIAISGGGRLHPRDHLSLAQRLGAAATLAKPVSASELIETVNAVLASPAATPSKP